MPRANPMNGEVALGDRKLRMNFAAWIAFEETSGRELPEHLGDLARGLSCIELVSWLQAFCADEISREDAIVLVDSAGYSQTLAAVNKATAHFFGDLVKDKPGNPPPAA